MRAACVIILASLSVFMSPVTQCQSLPGKEDPSIGELFQRAENLLISSMLTQMEDENNANGEEVLTQSEWMEKRQHTGKRQHPGKREDADYEVESSLEKRQHPGKREDEERIRRQHPGKRLSLEQRAGENPSAEIGLSKRQHPGRRYLMLLQKRQHPGRRELYESDRTAEDLLDLEKRQHPGKRQWEANPPCEDWDAAGCNQASILLEILENATKSRTEDKKQHPGKRFELEYDDTEQK